MKNSTFLLVAVALSGSAQAQVVPEGATCAKCSFDLRLVARLGTDALGVPTAGRGGITGRPIKISQDSKGRYWIAPLDRPRPLLYQSNGQFIGELGRDGDGPNEYRFASYAASLPGDSILLSTSRGMVVLKPDLKEARSINRSGLQDLAILRWPTAVLSQQSTYERGVGSVHTLRVFDLSKREAVTAKTVIAFPLSKGPSAAEQYAEVFRRFAKPAGDHVWVGQLSRYKLVRYNLNGVPQDSLIRSPTWFTGLKTMRLPSATTPPNPRLDRVAEDQQGRLWVYIAQPLSTAPKAWKDAGVKAQGGEMAMRDMPSDEKLYRTMLEVIDPKVKRVVARKYFDGYVCDVITSGRIAMCTEDEDGIPTVSVYDIILRGS